MGHLLLSKGPMFTFGKRYGVLGIALGVALLTGCGGTVSQSAMPKATHASKLLVTPFSGLSHSINYGEGALSVCGQAFYIQAPAPSINETAAARVTIHAQFMNILFTYNCNTG